MVSHDHQSHGRRAQRVRAVFGGAILLAAAGLSLSAGAAPAASFAGSDARCRAGVAQQAFAPTLPAARRALQETGRLTVVALGSSTTAGSGASAEDKSYPAVLQAELRRRLPGAEIRVVNKGVGGQSAYDMVMRMDGDVLEERPTLVIWQTVINDAIRDIGEEKLAKILRKGIAKARNAGMDMILMDLPWLPREGRYPHYDDYRGLLARIAQDQNVALFPRYAMMRGWARSKQFSDEELVGMDGVHLLDGGYRCLALRIADGIVSALGDVRIDVVRPAPAATE